MEKRNSHEHRKTRLLRMTFSDEATCKVKRVLGVRGVSPQGGFGRLSEEIRGSEQQRQQRYRHRSSEAGGSAEVLGVR